MIIAAKITKKCEATYAKMNTENTTDQPIPMLNNTTLKVQGMKVLAESLGLVDAERFIALMRREPFDYTEWQRELYRDVPLETFLKNADDFRNKRETS